MNVMPVRGAFTVTAAYGDVNSALWGRKPHAGVDIVCSDRRVYATCAGRVRVSAYDENGWGEYVTVGDGAGRIHLFAHLVKGSVLVRAGDAVTPETQLGTMGATGNVTGVHLHYQINDMNGTPQDPTPFLGIPNARGRYDAPADGGSGERESGAASGAEQHWAKQHYDALVARGAIDGGETSSVWRSFEASVGEIKVGQLLALLDKLTRK